MIGKGLSDFESHFMSSLKLGYLKEAGGSDSKESACKAGDSGSIPGLGSSPGGRNSYQFQYSGLENPRDRGAWLHEVAKNWTQLSTHSFVSNKGFTFRAVLASQHN